MDGLKKLRDRIDWLDTQIASLLNERMRVADQVGRVKRGAAQQVTDKSREMVVLEKVGTIVQHPILKAHIASIYNEIMHVSKITQQFYSHLTMPIQRIGIIGMGLMGQS